jgi:hypothetical protein
MAQLGYYTGIATKVERFWSRLATRWLNAVGQAQNGNYSAQQWASDMVMTATDASAAVGEFFEYGGNPTLPTVTFGVDANDIRTKPATAEAYLADALDPNDVITWTPTLILVGQVNPIANPITVSVSFASLWREKVTVAIEATSPPPTAAPDAGVYVGAIYGDDTKAIATIVANIL